MGTRGTILWVNKYSNGEEKPFCKLYNQYDSYLEGLGKEIATWILGKKIVNGYTLAQEQAGNYANGFEDLATLFIADYKHGIGGLHLIEPTLDHSTNELCDYNYEIVYNWTLYLPEDGIWADKMITIRVFNWESDKPIFVGSPRELLNYIREEEKRYEEE